MDAGEHRLVTPCVGAAAKIASSPEVTPETRIPPAPVAPVQKAGAPQTAIHHASAPDTPLQHRFGSTTHPASMPHESREIQQVRHDLLAWYDDHRRTLPWRAEPGRLPDVYSVFVSEVMLQQTRVETVTRHFGPWMERFPDWHALAQADEESVMAQWAGLGYYRRARNLHAAAKLVAAHGMPQDLRVLPGVGPYMAGAVASIARGEAVPAVDGNVVRVLSRLAHITDPVDRRAGRAQVEEVAAQLVDPHRPGDWNQALMDLGSALCTPRAPACPACPLASSCVARRTGAAADLPVTAARRPPVHEAHKFACVERDGRVLVVARPPGLLAGTWMLPGGPAKVPLEDWVRQQTGCEAVLGSASAARHKFTHRVWDMQVHGAVIHGDPEGHWVDPEAPDVALSAAARKAIDAGRRARLG